METNEKRTPKQLLDGNVPYKEMTEEEISDLLDYKIAAALNGEMVEMYANTLKKESETRIANDKKASEMLAESTDRMLTLLVGKTLELRSW